MGSRRGFSLKWVMVLLLKIGTRFTTKFLLELAVMFHWEGLWGGDRSIALRFNRGLDPTGRVREGSTPPAEDIGERMVRRRIKALVNMNMAASGLERRGEG